MLNKPPLNELLEHVDSRFTLVVAVSKRARQLVNNREYMQEAVEKPVTTAVNELVSGKLEYRRP